jgi:hypothetical protein
VPAHTVDRQGLLQLGQAVEGRNVAYLAIGQ